MRDTKSEKIIIFPFALKSLLLIAYTSSWVEGIKAKRGKIKSVVCFWAKNEKIIKEFLNFITQKKKRKRSEKINLGERKA